MGAFLKRRTDMRLVMLGQEIAYFCRLADCLRLTGDDASNLKQAALVALDQLEIDF